MASFGLLLKWEVISLHVLLQLSIVSNGVNVVYSILALAAVIESLLCFCYCLWSIWSQCEVRPFQISRLRINFLLVVANLALTSFFSHVNLLRIWSLLFPCAGFIWTKVKLSCLHLNFEFSPISLAVFRNAPRKVTIPGLSLVVGLVVAKSKVAFAQLSSRFFWTIYVSRLLIHSTLISVLGLLMCKQFWKLNRLYLLFVCAAVWGWEARGSNWSLSNTLVAYLNIGHCCLMRSSAEGWPVHSWFGHFWHRSCWREGGSLLGQR